ncbi:unnamed protein product [Callosobruchus maculatus]|uniref:Uncharacterized protein n=1 Tax=Callosobruchus maculatus TaxID=64391 RepID=A0A653DPN7_CALMS|nr:unnamed protein product [Callosobruchus maculatus]
MYRLVHQPLILLIKNMICTSVLTCCLWTCIIVIQYVIISGSAEYHLDIEDIKMNVAYNSTPILKKLSPRQTPLLHIQGDISSDPKHIMDYVSDEYTPTETSVLPNTEHALTISSNGNYATNESQKLNMVDTKENSEFHDSGNHSTYEAETENSNNITDSSKESLNMTIPKGTRPLDERQLFVPSSKNADGTKRAKQYFCPYCKQLQTKFARHLETKHKDEDAVKQFRALPKKNIKRACLIEKIRKYGNFLHNTDPSLNTGVLITCRRPQAKYDYTTKDFVACSHCKGVFSKKTLRVHHTKCNPKHTKGKRGQVKAGRRLMGFCHPEANETMQRDILPSLKDDEVGSLIKYDELIILFGNKQCNKYTQRHQHDMIRNRLRLLARFLLAAQQIRNTITDLASIYHPKFYRVAVEAVRICGNYDPIEGMFKTPFNALSLGSLLKKCAVVNKSRCIEQELDDSRQQMEKFFEIFEDDFPITINKKCLEDQMTARRMKKVALPSKEDIKKLYVHVKTICEKSVSILKEAFNRDAWIKLGQATLIFLMLFNRRRAGEIERLLVENYESRETLDDTLNSDIYKKLSNSAQVQASQFLRLMIRGKLGRNVPVLLHNFLVDYVDTLMKYRKRAGVKSTNKFVFAVPYANKHQKEYIRACPLMRKFSKECGAAVPDTLRGTTLRKHVATYTAMLRLEDTQVDFLCNYMGHHKDIHKNIYRVPNGVADMTEVSRLLQAAIGEDDESGNENEDDEDEPEIGSQPNTPTQHMETTEDIGTLSSEEEDDQESSSGTKRQTVKKPRKSSPRGKIKRRKWSEKEKTLIKDHFGEPSLLKKLPATSECREFIANHDVLRGRTAQQLKTWIDNQRKAKSRKADYRKKKYYF